MLPRIAWIALPLTSLASGADWPGWRGPGRDGVAPGVSAPADWPETLEELWAAEVGEGHSGPIVAGKQLFVFSRQGPDEVLRAFDLDGGKELWRQSYAAPYEVNPHAVAHGPGPKATPELRGGRLVTLGVSGILTCREAATGTQRWQKSCAAEFPRTSPLYGTSMSPLIAGGLVIAHVGGHDQGALRAFDVETGVERWSLGGDGPAYASPVLAELGGVTQVVTQTQTNLVGVSLDGGALLWKVPFTTEYDQNSVTPLVHRDLVIYSGYMKSTAGVRLEKQAAGLAVRPAWEAAEVPMFMSSPVLLGGALYGMSQKLKGHLFRLDPASGKVDWKGPGRLGENASLIVAGGHLLVLTEAGELQVHRPVGAAGLELGRKYRVSSSPTWAHLTVGRGRIVVKDRTHVRVLALPGS